MCLNVMHNAVAQLLCCSRKLAAHAAVLKIAVLLKTAGAAVTNKSRPCSNNRAELVFDLSCFRMSSYSRSGRPFDMRNINAINCVSIVCQLSVDSTMRIME